MPELVELEYRIVKIRESKMRGYYVGLRVVGGVLYRREIVYLFFTRNDYDAAGVLSRCALYAHTMADYAVCLGTAHRLALGFEIFRHKAVCRLVGKRTERSRTENVFGAKQLFGKLMYPALHLAREVEVDIGRFFTVKSEKGLKRNVLTVLRELFAAHGAVARGHIKARADLIRV